MGHSKKVCHGNKESVSVSHIFRTINRYHDRFESYKEEIGLSKPLTWLAIFSGVAMGFFFIKFISATELEALSFERYKYLLTAFAFEIIALLCWFVMTRRRDEKAVKKCQAEFKIKSRDLGELKKIWLASTLKEPRVSYLALAKEVEEFLNILDRHRPSTELSKEFLMNLIYSKESKNRILALFMGSCAITTALSIATGANIEYVFSFFHEARLLDVFSLILTISVFLIFTALSTRYLLLIIVQIVSNVRDDFKGMNSRSRRRSSSFIRQLIELHEFEKARVPASYKTSDERAANE